MREPAGDRSWPAVLDEIAGALETLTPALCTEEDFTVLLGRICEPVAAAVPGVDEASITLMRDREAITAATTNEIVARLDSRQYATGDGPCIRAALSGELVRVSIAEAREAWPVFACDAEAAGFGSFLSAPLAVEDGYAGSVNCYSVRGHGFAEVDEKLLCLYTTVATLALRLHVRYARTRDAAEHLRKMLDSRAVIDQAKGILMAIRQITSEEAFTLLVEQSQRENIKVYDLAIRLINHATRSRKA